MDAIAVDPALVADLVCGGFVLGVGGLIIEEAVNVSGPGGDLELELWVVWNPHVEGILNGYLIERVVASNTC